MLFLAYILTAFKQHIEFHNIKQNQIEIITLNKNQIGITTLNKNQTGIITLNKNQIGIIPLIIWNFVPKEIFMEMQKYILKHTLSIMSTR